MPTYLTVSRDATKDPASALSQMVVAGRRGVKDSVWKFAMSGPTWYYLTGLRFTMRTSSGSTLNIPRARVDTEGAWSCWDSDKTAIPQPTETAGEYTVTFNFNPPCRLNGNQTSYYTVRYDLSLIGGQVRNDTRFFTTLEDAEDILWNGADHPLITMDDNTTASVYRYQLESYPTLNFVKTSAADVVPLKPATNTLIASLGTSAQPEKGVTFTRGISQNRIKFRVEAFAKDDGRNTGGWKIVNNATGKVLQSSTDDLESLQWIDLRFLSSSLFIPQIGGAGISIYADTTAFEDAGDWIRVSIEEKIDNTNWTLTNIEGGGLENFQHGDIIARGGLRAQKLVKS